MSTAPRLVSTEGNDLAVPLTWNAGLILLSYLQAVQAAHTAFHILQLRVSRWMSVVGALCLSVSGIWSMHFIGMVALNLPVDVTYNLSWTIASAFFAFFPCACALLLAGEMIPYTPVTSTTINAHIVAFKETAHGWLLLAGTLIALGVCAMHYTGMHAMHSAAVHEIHWGVLAASCIVALVAATAALYFAFVLPLTRAHTLPTSLVAGAAVCGMHYTGMYAYTFRVAHQDRVQGSNELAPAVPYIIAGSWFISYGAQAIATHMYRENLKAAEDRAKNGVEFATCLGRLVSSYDLDGATNFIQGYKKNVDEALQQQLALMLANLQPYRAYLPQTLFAEDDASGAEAVEQEEDLDPEAALSDIATSSDAGMLSSDMENSKRSIGNEVTVFENSFSASRSAGDSCHTTSSMSSRAALVSRQLRGWSGPDLNPLNVLATGNGSLTPLKGSGSSPSGGKTVAVLVVNLRRFHSHCTLDGFCSGAATHSNYVSAIAKAAMTNRGIVDSLQGDHVLVTWNAANSVPNYLHRAAKCAVDIRRSCGGLSCSVTMGLSWGKAYVGNLGNNDVRRFCIIGQVIKDAYILERLAKQYEDAMILTTERVVKELGPDCVCEHVDVLPLPAAIPTNTQGRHGRVKAFPKATPKQLFKVDSGHGSILRSSASQSAHSSSGNLVSVVSADTPSPSILRSPQETSSPPQPTTPKLLHSTVDGIILSTIDEFVTMRDDEWMYQLQNADKGNPHRRWNHLVEGLRDGSVEALREAQMLVDTSPLFASGSSTPDHPLSSPNHSDTSHGEHTSASLALDADDAGPSLTPAQKQRLKRLLEAVMLRGSAATSLDHYFNLVVQY